MSEMMRSLKNLSLEVLRRSKEKTTRIKSEKDLENFSESILSESVLVKGSNYSKARQDYIDGKDVNESDIREAIKKDTLIAFGKAKNIKLASDDVEASTISFTIGKFGSGNIVHQDPIIDPNTTGSINGGTKIELSLFFVNKKPEEIIELLKNIESD